MARLSIASKTLVGLMLVTMTSVMVARLHAATLRFTAVDLGTLGGATSFPLAMSDAGAAVGYSDTASMATHGFKWTRGTGMVDLGTLGGTISIATSVNERGSVAGASDTTNNAERHAFLWHERTGMTDLGTLGPAFAGSYATGVNSTSMVVGYSWKVTDDFSTHGFVWTRKGGMKDIGSFGGDTFPNAVNEAGVVVGIAYREGNHEARPFAWTRSRGMIDLGSLGGQFGEALAVSETGIVVGYSYTAGDVSYPHPFAWTELTGMIDLGTLRNGTSGSAHAVNDYGVTVGYSTTVENEFIRGFVWRPLRRPHELGAPGRESYAAGVSNDGLVVGNNYTEDGFDQIGFAWTRNDGMVDLRPRSGQFSQIVGVTNNDVAFGFGYDLSGGHATIWRPQ